MDECVEVSSALFGDGVAGEEAAEVGGVVAEVVVDEVEFGVVVLRGPLEGLGDVAGFRYVPEGSVGIRRADIAGGAEDFADIFGDVVAVGEPRAVFLNRERTRRRRLRRIPGDEPQRRMTGTRAIHAGNLQISAINVAMMKRYRSRDRYFFEVAPTLRVVAAVNRCIRFFITETHRTIRAVVGDRPRSRGRLNQRRVPVGVVAWIKRKGRRGFGRKNFRVLIEIVCRVGECRSRFGGSFAVTDVVKRVGVIRVPERRGGQFRTRIVAEGVILRRAVARSRARERTPERIVSVID